MNRDGKEPRHKWLRLSFLNYHILLECFISVLTTYYWKDFFNINCNIGISIILVLILPISLLCSAFYSGFVCACACTCVCVWGGVFSLCFLGFKNRCIQVWIAVRRLFVNLANFLSGRLYNGLYLSAPLSPNISADLKRKNLKPEAEGEFVGLFPCYLLVLSWL